MLSAVVSEFLGPGAPGVEFACVGAVLVVLPSGNGGCADALVVLTDLLDAFHNEGFADDSRFNAGLGCQVTTPTTSPTTTTTPTTTVLQGFVDCRNDFSSFAFLLGAASSDRSTCHAQATAINAVLAACGAATLGGEGTGGGPDDVAGIGPDSELVVCTDTAGVHDLLASQDSDTCSSVADLLNTALAAFHNGPSSASFGGSPSATPAVGCVGPLLTLSASAECNTVAGLINEMLEGFHSRGIFDACRVTTATTTQTSTPTTSTPTTTQYDASIGCEDVGAAGFLLSGLATTGGGGGGAATSGCADHGKVMATAVQLCQSEAESATFAAAETSVECSSTSSFGLANIFTVVVGNPLSAITESVACTNFVTKLQEAATAFLGRPSVPLACFGNTVLVPRTDAAVCARAVDELVQLLNDVNDRRFTNCDFAGDS